jgi:hypothetical protein
VRRARSLVQRSPTESGVPEYDHESSIIRTPWSTWGCCALVEKSVSRIYEMWLLSNETRSEESALLGCFIDMLSSSKCFHPKPHLPPYDHSSLRLIPPTHFVTALTSICRFPVYTT